MIAVGIVLVLVGLLGGGLLGYAALQQSDSVSLVAGGVSVSVSPFVLFLSGALAVLLIWLGFRLTVAAARRSRARRAELKELRASGATTTVPTGSTTGSTGTPVTRPDATAAPRRAVPPPPSSAAARTARASERDGGSSSYR